MLAKVNNRVMNGFAGFAGSTGIAGVDIHYFCTTEILSANKGFKRKISQF